MLTQRAGIFAASLSDMIPEEAQILAKWLVGPDAYCRLVDLPTGEKRCEIWGKKELGGRNYWILFGTGAIWRGAFLSLYCRCESATIAAYMLSTNLESMEQQCESENRTISDVSSPFGPPPR